jgi:hypothetical protein
MEGSVKDSDHLEGDCISSYVPPHPEKGSGAHRFCYLLMEQQAKIDPSSLHVER